ncbi:preprotein translocase subunit SecE [Rothia dentocariosa]|uniref:preprotein translocase subunit SecE n=1 Tax=Rothia dentocariosa TaxID=2047 RepID=UPI000C7BB16A|nr:preprotein translocase subunit SecE [Rothia dentocariosa]PLA18696.1 preprotein translocase subunit SecE [Rothia dentocariosa]
MAKTATVKTTDTDISDDVQPGVFGRMFRFLREVISELKKVTTPTRKELAIYFFGVLFFVVFMILFISGLDWVFGQGSFWVFGNGTLSPNQGGQ